MDVETEKNISTTNSRNPPNRERANLSSDGIENVQAKRLIKQKDGTFMEVPRCPKRRYAVLVAYCGSGYRGLQINPGAKTIELDLANAFFCAGGILDTNVHKLQRIGWSRSARTDKGVHAAMNLITAKLMVGLEEGDDEKFISRCNANLPETIRVLQLTIVTKSFNAQRHCAKRRYEYIMPTFMFRRDPAFLRRGWRYVPRNAKGSLATILWLPKRGCGSTVSFYSGRQDGWRRHRLFLEKKRKMALNSSGNVR